MRVIVIDSEKQQVREAEISKAGSLEAMQKIVGGHIELLPGSPLGDDLFVNEEGAINGTARGFMLAGWPYPIMGNAVVIGHDKRGNSAPAMVSLEFVSAQVVSWVERKKESA